MPAVSLEQSNEVRRLIKHYLEKYGMTSYGKIAKYVKEKSGYTPSRSTIWRIVNEKK